MFGDDLGRSNDGGGGVRVCTHGRDYELSLDVKIKLNFVCLGFGSIFLDEIELKWKRERLRGEKEQRTVC